MIEFQLAKVMSNKRLTCRDVVKMTGLDNHTVRKLFLGEISRIEFKTLDKLCYALECKVSDILVYKNSA